MAMGSIGGAFLAASSFLGLGSLRASSATPRAFEADEAGRDDVPALPAIAAFAPGEPYFEAVAQALGEAGYLDA